MAWLYTVLNPTKAAGGVWWIWYSSKCKASMAWLYTVLNPTKAAGGVWWIWFTCGYMLYSLGYILGSTESIKIRQNQEKDFGGFGLVRVYSLTPNKIYIQIWLVGYFQITNPCIFDLKPVEKCDIVGTNKRTCCFTTQPTYTVHVFRVRIVI